ncbi:MAG: hypothetical protein R6U98_11460 [Pirellulaceae bacterium]
MTRVAVADDIALQIRNSEGPIELIDPSGQTIGIVRRPPTESEIERARSRASQDGKRLSWAQVVAKVQDGASE